MKLKNNESDVKKILGKHVPTWRVQETSSVDVSIDGLGWANPDDKALRGQLLDVLNAFAQIARKYEPELRKVINEAE